MSNFKKYFLLFVVFFPFFPVFVFAAGSPENFSQLLGVVINLIQLIIPVLFSLAILGFVYGLANYLLQADNEIKRSEGKKFMVGGLIGLFVMVSVWGLVSILDETFFNQSENGTSGDYIWKFNF